MRPFPPYTLPLLLALAIPVCQANEIKSSPAYQQTAASLHKEGGFRVIRYSNLQVPQPDTSPRTHKVENSHGNRFSRVIARALELIGIPYRRGGSSVAGGFDCSGLLVYLFRTQADMELPRTTGEMIQSDEATRIRRDQLKPGDAVFFNRNGRGRTSHVGLYIGHGQFIHAPRTGERIRKDSLDDEYWQRSYITARRFEG
ncbi:C40 family peptidase [Pseudomonas sp. PDNC002]|uniref:C40 family peptidase n=1 Tax=Pseudomonas sp. PDNC002 TaxID=2811422 RepID=UPI0019641314|nr:C40 family peptidase [Pseudomonas sp. PDNC002]QRY78107.1 C40 family peptidase [Pseudomonas sp. PDNC002]